MFKKLATFTSRYPVFILVAAGLIVLASVTYGLGVFNKLDSMGFEGKKSESTAVTERLNRSFSKDNPSLVVLFKSKDGSKVGDLAYKQAAQAVLSRISQDTSVAKIVDYYSTGSPALVSKDGTSTYAAIVLKGNLDDRQTEAVHLRDTLSSSTLQLSYGGTALITHDINKQITDDLALAETISFSVLSVLLVLVFRSIVAALLPLILAGFSVLSAFLVLRLMSGFTTISQYAVNVIIFLGLGLAVDYSLLIVSRFREELARAHNDKHAALVHTMHTAGHTVFFSGLTVMICLLSLVVFPLPFLRSMGLGGAAAVCVAMLAALIVLPAILILLGSKIDVLAFGSVRRYRQALTHGEQLAEKQSVWVKVGSLFMRRPIVTVAVALALLLFAGSPFLHVKFSSPDQRVLPPSAQSRQVSDRLQREFEYTGSPIRVLYTSSSSLTNQENIAKLYDYTRSLQRLPGVRSVESIVNVPVLPSQSKEEYLATYANLAAVPQLATAIAPLLDGDTTVLTISYQYDSRSQEAQQLVQKVRALRPPAGSTALVGGETAALIDQLAVIKAHLPIALGIMAVAIFVLLFLMLGSVIIPLKAMLQNTLSLAVSFGALVWVFQYGHLAHLLHMNPTGSVDATQPIIIFAIAFGLSMDYSVFLYGRIKEQYDTLGDTRQAILSGLQKTGNIITSAALLLFVVVVAFATSRITIMQQIGLGLALAVLIDAFVVRMVLVPATMALFGRWNWWAPKALKRWHAKLGFEERK